ncbi:MAG: OmpA family protein [Paludibacter sp.]
MKKAITTILSVLLLFPCNSNNKNEDKQTDKQATVTEKGDESEIPVTGNFATETSSFDINTVPLSSENIGDFPFFTLPKGLKSQNKPLQRDFDVCFFPINGVMNPFEGKLYKINVVGDGNEPFSQRYFEKSLENYLISKGAVKVFDGEITQDEYERYNKQDPNKGDEGDIGYAGEQIKFFIIRTKDKGNIFVQFSANNASGKLNIIQEEPLEQTIKKITSDEIVKDLNEKGKSILYINFDVDKSTIKPDGKEIVDQIAKALQQDASLKISIEGHTDNTGTPVHNKKLSDDRANAVLQSLINAGIDKSRLTAQGFGAEKPLFPNDSEENKAKNRRVELVKL